MVLPDLYITITTTMFLSATQGPYAGRRGWNSRNQPRDKFFD